MKFLIFPLLIITACSTNQKVSLQSYPPSASVSLETSTGEKKALGETPLNLNGQELFDGKNMAFLEVSKEGFEKQKIFLTRNSSTENFDVSVKLTPTATDLKAEKGKDRQEQLAKSLARISGLISKKKYDEAERLLFDLARDFPHISVTYDLLGNIYYLRGSYRKALEHYKRALSLNPENSETRNMIDKLEKEISL